MSREPRFLLDSTILIDHLNGSEEARKFLHDHSTESSVSVITINEVLAGSKPSAVASHELLLDQFECLPVDILTAKASAASNALRSIFSRRQLSGGQHRWKRTSSCVCRTVMPVRMVIRTQRVRAGSSSSASELPTITAVPTVPTATIVFMVSCRW